jgi:L-ribulose-5-phosphate 3-epimerase
MLISCSPDAFGSSDMALSLAAIHDAGLKYIEVPSCWIGPPDDQTLSPDDARLDRLLELLAAHELRAGTLSVTVIEPHEENALERLSAGLRAAIRLGCNVVVAAAGSAATEADRRRLLDQHRRLGDEAGELGLVVAFETLPGLCDDSRAMHQTMQDLDHPALRLHFDTGGCAARNPWSSWEVALQRVCGWLGGLRLTDTSGTPGEFDMPPLGQGATIDFTRTLQIVQAVGFRGPATIDFRVPARRGTPPLEKCVAGLARSVAQLRRGGWFC